MSTLRTDTLKTVDDLFSIPVNKISSVDWARSPLSSDITTISQALSAQVLNIWEYADLVVNKPTPNDPSTWDWSPAVQQAFTSLGSGGVLDFGAGTFKFSGVTTTKTISIKGRGAASTFLLNFTAGATMLSYTQVGMADKDRRNWLTMEGFTMRDEGSFTGIGIKTDGVLSVIIKDAYIRDFKTNYGLQVLEGLWIYLKNVNSDLCEFNFVSTAGPHNNNVICIDGGELRNPTPGRHSLYVETGDIVSLRNATVEGNTGGPGYIAGAKFKSVKMLSIESTYFEVLSTATEGALVIEGCQSVSVSRSQINSQSTTVPSALCVDSDSVKFSECVMVAFPIRATGFNNITFENCMSEGPIDLSATTTHRVISPMPYNTRATIVTNPSLQSMGKVLPKAFRNSYADSSIEVGAPGGTIIVAGAPVSTHDTTQGYFGGRSWRVSGVVGDSIRSGTLGVTTANGQSGCMTFMAKADSPGRFALSSFLGGAAGGTDIYLSTEWRRYFVITNLRPASTAGDSFLLQMGFLDTNAFNITDIQFVPFVDYGEIPGIVDGYNYIPTHGTAQTSAISKVLALTKQYFDRGLNHRKTTLAPAVFEDGDVYYADGTTWNPGSGQGLYFNRGSTLYQLPATLSGSVTYDPPSLADAAGTSTTVTVTGAALGDLAIASFSLDTQGIIVTANVTSANTVTVRFQNETGGVIDLASGTLRARVIKT